MELVRVIALLPGLPSPTCRFRGRPSPEHSSARYRVARVVLPARVVLRRPPTSHRAPATPSPSGLIGVPPPRAPCTRSTRWDLQGVTTCSSAPCRPHTPWSEGWMENAFIAIVPTRPCPLFGRPVHRRDGSHRFRPGASPQALRIPPRGGHPALLDVYRGQRDVTPAFGYGALHPSTSGTSTHLSMSLPSAHYGIWSPTCRRQLEQARALLTLSPLAPTEPAPITPATPSAASDPPPMRCPQCRTGILIRVGILAPHRMRAP